jgi:hypothetical protein
MRSAARCAARSPAGVRCCASQTTVAGEDVVAVLAAQALEADLIERAPPAHRAGRLTLRVGRTA